MVNFNIMKIYHFPLLVITPALMGGIVVDKYFAVGNMAIYVLLVISFVLLIYSHFQSNRKMEVYAPYLIALIMTGFFAGIYVHKAHNPIRKASHFSHLIPNNQKVYLKLSITKRLKPTIVNQRFYAQVLQVNDKPASGILLVKDHLQSNISVGNQLELLVDSKEIKPIAKPKNMYDFDYAAYLRNKGIVAQINLENQAFTVYPTPTFNLYHLADKVRNSIIGLFEQNHITGKKLGLAKALFTGDRTDLDPKTVQDFQASGTVHILAISGLHIGILLMFINFVFGFIKRRLGNLVFLVFSIGVLWFYAFITGFSPSVTRAVIMFSFLQIGVQSKRKTNIYNTLFAAALLMILYRPNVIFEVGFQMSFAAVLSIVSFYPVFSKIYSPRHKMLKWWWDIFLVSLAAQLGVFPLSIYYFHQFPTYFFLANLWVIPLLFILLSYGFFVILLGLSHITIAYAWNLFDFLLELLLYINNFIASLAHSLIDNIHISRLQIVLIFALIVALYRVLHQAEKQYTIIYFLGMLILLQLSFVYEKVQTGKQQDFFVLQRYKEAVYGKIRGDEVDFYAQKSQINAYILRNFNIRFKQLHFKKPQFLSLIHQDTILHIDSLEIYAYKHLHPKIICLHYSPKINVDRLLYQFKPEILVVDGSNFKTYIDRWQQSAKRYQVAFYDTNRKGAFVWRQWRKDDEKNNRKLGLEIF